MLEPENLLPITGPLGRVDYNPTNRDLLDNAYKQNIAINAQTMIGQQLQKDVQALAITVNNHAKVIDTLGSIKTIAIWILSFVGLGGLGSLLNWLNTFHH